MNLSGSIIEKISPANTGQTQKKHLPAAILLVWGDAPAFKLFYYKGLMTPIPF